MTDEVTPTREQCIEWLYRKLPQMNPTINALTKATIAHLRTPRVEAGDGDEFSAWSFLRNVLSQGMAIQQDYQAGKYADYELLSARLDEAARERDDELLRALSRRPSEAWDGARGDVADEDVRALLKYAQDNPRALFADLIAKVCGALLSRTAAPSRRLTGAEREACERAAKADEGMARICHAAGKSFETQQHLHDAATLRALASEDGAAVGAWQPIETAPKDGTFVFLYWPTLSMTRYPAVGFHHGDEYGWSLADRDYGEIYPTHWSPLFEPPSPPEGGRT